MSVNLAVPIVVMLGCSKVPEIGESFQCERLTPDVLVYSARAVMDPLYESADWLNWQWEFGDAHAQIVRFEEKAKECYEYNMKLVESYDTYEERDGVLTTADTFSEIRFRLAALNLHLEAYSSLPAVFLRSPPTWRSFYETFLKAHDAI